jgi:hypothetical protein
MTKKSLFAKQKYIQDSYYKNFSRRTGLSNLHRLAEIRLIMCSTATFAAEEPGFPDKLPDQFLVLTLCNPAKMVLAATVISTPARGISSLSHIETSLIITIKTSFFIILIMNRNELFMP